MERQSEEQTYLWIPFQFLNQTIQAILKCLGLLHQDTPTEPKTSSSPGTLNQPEEEKNEDGTDTDEDEVVVTSRAARSSGRSRAKPKEIKTPERSRGRPGQRNIISPA